MSTATDGDQGFFGFYREYAHTGIHATTTAALTAFGLLTFVHQGFVALAIGVYVLPPILLYLTREEAPEPVDGDGAAGEGTTDRRTTDEPSPAAEPTAEADATDTDVPSAGGAGEEPNDLGATPEEPTADAGASEREPAGTGADPADGGSAAPSDTEGSRREGSEPAPTAGAGAAGSEPGTGSGADESPGTGSAATSGSPDDGSGGGAVADEGTVADNEGDEGEEDEGGSAEWVEADSPTEETLLDAVSAGEGAYAAGKNGALLARSEDGDWELALESGPAAESTTLRGVDATDDGEAIWVAGDSGVLGRYDPATARHTDHSAPAGITDNWSGLAVAGAAGEERVALVNGSGQVLFGAYDGSEVEWEEPVKPGSGSSMSAIAFVTDSLGYCCDTNAGVYRVEGSEFERIGIEDASGFDALAATGDTVAVASGDGTVQRFDGSVWTPVRVAEGALSGLATDGEEWLAVGASGTIHENREGDWEAVDSPTEADLHGVAVGKIPVVVGEGGAVLERV